MMARYLVTLSIGPVQSLIGAARRTRDLWCGSWLLSEVSRAAALALHRERPGALIFPSLPAPDVDLQPRPRPGDGANIANVLRAEVDATDERELRALCALARRAATRHLKDLGKGVRSQLPGLRTAVWDAQTDDLLECFCAWAEVEANDYAGASQRLGMALAARKATRDCLPTRPLAETGLPKSSLDGAMETVLPRRPEPRLVAQLGLGPGEQLDALGVIKRHAGQVDQFTAYARIAADPWLETLTDAQLAGLHDRCEPLVESGLATRVRGNDGIYSKLPFDGQLLFDFRLDSARASAVQDTQTDDAIEAMRRALVETAAQPGRGGEPCGSPVPYAVVLQADGDRMGALLSSARSADEACDISRALHGFAGRVRATVRGHRGHAVYAGGDDVLALLPLVSAVACAQALAEDFATSMAKVADAMGVAASDWPTLSVGLGIGHLMEPLGSLRERAGRAEKLAKGDDLAGPAQRNALGVVLGVRAGGETEWRARWDAREALEALASLTNAYRDHRLPSRVAYDLRAIDARLAWLRDATDETARGMREAELRRLLLRARAEGGRVVIDAALQALLVERVRASTLGKVADMLIIARWLAARTHADLEYR